MQEFFFSFLKMILGFGMMGLFLLAIVDATPFFFLPFALDAILIIQVSRYDSWMPIYAFVSAVGSMLGCLVTYYIVSKSSEQTLEKFLPKKRFDRVKRKMEKNAFWALLLAGILPPPFPFTPFILMAGIIKYSYQRVALAVFCGKFARFLAEGLLAIYFGKRIIKWLDAPALKYLMMFIFIVAMVGSTITIYKWLTRKK